MERSRPRDYTLTRVLAVWAAAALPMAVLAWVVAPALIPRVSLAPAIVFWLMTMVGMAWQLALSLWLVRREEGDLRWRTIRRRAWLGLPRDPRTGQARPGLWKVTPYLLLASASIGLGALLTSLAPMLRRFLGLPHSYLAYLWPPYANVSELASPDLAGQWWLVGVAVVSALFSAFLAEEFLFRGVLLPRMRVTFGRWDWVANATLFALYYLHKPWMVPFRLIGSLALAWPSRRYQCNWFAVVIRGAEGLALVAIVMAAVSSPAPGPLPASITAATIERRPSATGLFCRAPAEIPAAGVDSPGAFGVDLRGCDLSARDLRDSAAGIAWADFDARTVWPPADRRPESFEPDRLLDVGKDPGLGVRGLHERGITGRGVGVAIVDQQLLTGHQEYADRLRWYEEIPAAPGSPTSMHGPAVASLAVGKTVGVAPGADLYFIGVDTGLSAWLWNFHYYAQAVRRIVAINERLPVDRKIRVISMSIGWSPEEPGYYELTRAVAEAEAAGLLVLYTSNSHVQGLGRAPLADPNVVASYGPGAFWSRGFYAGIWDRRAILAPMDSRTIASPGGPDEYAFIRVGGLSWAIPYVAGVYALAAQVDPAITPERFWSLASQTGRSVEVEHDGQRFSLGPIISPVDLVSALPGHSVVVESGQFSPFLGVKVPDSALDLKPAAELQRILSSAKPQGLCVPSIDALSSVRAQVCG